MASLAKQRIQLSQFGFGVNRGKLIGMTQLSRIMGKCHRFDHVNMLSSGTP